MFYKLQSYNNQRSTLRTKITKEHKGFQRGHFIQELWKMCFEKKKKEGIFRGNQSAQNMEQKGTFLPLVHDFII